MFFRRFRNSLLLTLAALTLVSNFQSVAHAGLNPLPGGLARTRGALRPPQLPATGALFSALVAVSGDHGGATERESTESFEAMVGRTVVVDKEHHAWDEAFPAPYAYWSRDKGRILAFEWNARYYDGSVVQWADIANGDYDALIDARANDIKAFAAPAFFIFHHEPEDEVGLAGTEQDYVDAYRHVVDRFRAKGVTNLSYAFVLMASTYRYGEPDLFYPGNSYVNVMGADGYNWYSCPGRDDAWQEFSWIFSDFREYGIAHGKPLFMAEWGSMEDPAVEGRKAQWIADAAETIKSWPEVKMLAYYHNGTPAANCDWWIDSSDSSLEAFTAMGADSYFNPAIPAPKPTKVTAYASVSDLNLSSIVGDLVQGRGVQWRFDGPSSHALTDNHGMGLFNSGTRVAGTSYQFLFTGAGSYNYKCSVHPSMLGTLRVPLVVTPGSGGVGTTFTVTWAAGRPPTGYLYDVKIQRPGSGWAMWKDGVTSTTSTFVPDTGTGRYLFKSRIRQSATGFAAWYSTEVSITVS